MNTQDNKLTYEYRGFEIRLFHNSGKWDYTILYNSQITSGYKSRRKLYNTREEALKNAKKQIDDSI
ncbi:MAG: hypothetical protein ACOCQ5_05050 [Halanaerobiales bacterium]